MMRDAAHPPTSFEPRPVVPVNGERDELHLTLRGTLGGRPIAWRVCDRATLRHGLVVERESYFDPTPLLRAVLTRPRAWPVLARARRRRHRTSTTDRRDHATGRPPARPPTNEPRGG
jgi:hypothetical protein